MQRLGTIQAGVLPKIGAFLVAALALGACGSGADVGADLAQHGPDDGRPVAASAGVGDERDSQGQAGGESRYGHGSDGGRGLFELIEERIVKTGEMSLEVENVAAALGRVRSIIADLGGYVGGSQAGALGERAILTVRVPADAFDTLLARLHELDADVLAETTREEVVTSQVVDLAARVENLRASEASYRELLGRAERIDDVLAVQSRLDGVRGEIEQLEAQLEALEDQAALSTLTVTLVPRAKPVEEQTGTWDPGAELDGAVASLVGIGQGLLDAAIWFAVVWLPILGVLAIVGLLVLRGVLELRRRLPAEARSTPPAPDRPSP